jgi:DNA polymerase-1
MKRILLIDGHSVLYRSYFGMLNNPRITSKGENVSAVFGFLNTLEDVLKRYKPTHAAVAFDPGGPTFRHATYSEYKAERDKIPEDILKALPLVRQLLDLYRIGVYQVEGFEADDVIGTLRDKAVETGFEVYIVTPDKDYVQLVGQGVCLCKPQGGGEYEELDEQKVKEKYGLETPAQFIEMLAMVGDVADNIPGCPGIGEKTASRLLDQFGTVEGVISHVKEVKGVLRYKIQQNAEAIRFSRMLATIKRDVPLVFKEEDCKLGEKDEAALREFYEQLEFRTHLKKLGGGIQGDLFEEEKKKSVMGRPSVESYRQPEVEVLWDSESWQRLDGALKKEKCVSLSLEKEGLGMAVDGGCGWYVPFGKEEGDKGERLRQFTQVFENEEIEKTGYNLKKVIKELRKVGIELKGLLYDTMIAHWLMHPELPHTQVYLYSTLLKYNGESDGAPAWGGESAALMMRLREKLAIEPEEMRKVFERIEMPLVYVLAEMEEAGVKVDGKALKHSSKLLSHSLGSLEESIYIQCEKRFNINSPRQLAELLEEHFGLKVGMKTKTGKVSTGEAALEGLRDAHPVIGQILEYKHERKLLNTYMEVLPQMINPGTGKIHTTYHQATVSTGRLSSSDPNLQNIPVRHDVGKEIRKAFTADDEGCVFFSADYSQIELRILAHLSRDILLLSAFHSGEDVHASTASKIYKVPVEEVTVEMRRKAKIANFGIIYGISAFGLSRSLHISREESTALIEGYFATYPEVSKYIERTLDAARKDGYVETIMGRRTRVTNLLSSNRAVRAAAERFVTNAPIQGSAADVIKIAMIRICQRFKEEGMRARMIMQVHDELNFNVPKEELETVRAIVVKEMEGAYDLEVPLVVDWGYGANWLEAH